MEVLKFELFDNEGFCSLM